MIGNVGERQHAMPLVIDSLGSEGSAHALQRLTLGRATDGTVQHDEAWLQRLIHAFPQVLPIDEIEPAFGTLIAVCRELATAAGFADNLFLTPTGDLVLAECKLWRNPEARREVVAQAIDYAESMSRLSYEELEATALKAGLDGGSLFALVEDETHLDEAGFVDAVSRNLRLGRVHLMIVGDGIREGVESLTRSIQRHAGFHFTMSLVELPVYALPAGGYVVLPRILARTTNIERGIVKLSDDRLQVEATEPPVRTRGEARSISQERILETIRANAPEAAEALDAFLAKATDLGVFAAPATKSMVIRWRGPDDRDFSLGAIGEGGELITYNVNWSADFLGRVDLAHEYLARIAETVGGKVRQTKTPQNWYVVREGTTQPDAVELLKRDDAWLAIIQDYAGKLTEAMRDS